MDPRDTSYQDRVNARKRVAKKQRTYANRHLAGNIVRHFVGGEQPHLDTQAQDLSMFSGDQPKVNGKGPWKAYKTADYPTGKHGNYFIWAKRVPTGQVIYNVTTENVPPSDEDGGYYELGPLLSKKKSSMFAPEDPFEGGIFDDDDLFDDDEFFERNNMRYRNINPLREDMFSGPSENEQPMLNSDISFMDDIFHGGGTSVDLGPQTDFDYALPARGSQELDLDGVLGEEPMKKSVWESQEVKGLIDECVRRGLTKPQIERVLSYHGIMSEGKDHTAKVFKDKDGYSVALFSNHTGDRKDIIASGLQKAAAEKKAREYNQKK